MAESKDNPEVEKLLTEMFGKKYVDDLKAELRSGDFTLNCAMTAIDKHDASYFRMAIEKMSDNELSRFMERLQEKSWHANSVDEKDEYLNAQQIVGKQISKNKQTEEPCEVKINAITKNGDFDLSDVDIDDSI